MACFWVPGVRFNDFLFTEPVPLTGWRPPGWAGVLAVLSRNPQWSPKPFQPLYFGEMRAGERSELPRLPEHVHPEELLVAVLPLPYSTVTQRHTIRRELIAAYRPVCQAHDPHVSTVELAGKVEEMEARQQEQSQQILSLLSHLAKLFEPQPVGPRRPIGFLPQFAPAGPAITETDS